MRLLREKNHRLKMFQYFRKKNKKKFVLNHYHEAKFDSFAYVVAKIATKNFIKRIEINVRKIKNAKQFSKMKNIISKFKHKLNMINEILHNIFNVYRHVQRFD